MAGLYPISVIARFLGKRDDETKSMIDLDGLPVISVPAKTKPMNKVALMPFHGWLKKRSKNGALSVDELRDELERVEASVGTKQTKKEAAA